MDRARYPGIDRIRARSLLWLATGLAGALLGTSVVLAQEPPRSPLTTQWGGMLEAEHVLQAYPRPQLVRDAWLNLNGIWEFALLSPTAERPEQFEDRILVPFPVESALSGVMSSATNKGIWYRRTFAIPEGWNGQRVLLHFGAIDWESQVWVNGALVGEHLGGYDPFFFDITETLLPTGPQEIVVRAWDPSDGGEQPHGKQVRQPGGIWYTASSGIWQTVWLEPVSQSYIADLSFSTDIDAGLVRLTASIGGPVYSEQRLEAVLFDGEDPVATDTVEISDGASHASLELTIDDPKMWSPDSPFLYDLRVRLIHRDEAIDEVQSYTALRSIELGPDQNGDLRLLLNGEPLFHLGVLDQGFWPDGLYTAPSDEALRFDLETAKRLGFNMIRKHVKVEPARWYYWADRLGLLVWQDIPNGGDHAPTGSGEITRDQPSAQQFELELERIIAALEDHPSVVVWVLFNEGWGQYDTVRITNWLTARDPSRLVDSVSGWNDMGVGDLVDVHAYPGPAAPPTEARRAAVLGEFGGLGLPVAGLTWQNEANWGYRAYDDAQTWFSAYRELLEEVRALQASAGLAAAVYTQLTDVESEVNGLLTYDRALTKMEAPRLRSATGAFAQPLPRRRALVPASGDPAAEGTRWRYTTDSPAEGWQQPGFDDSDWRWGYAGFGRPDSPGAVVRTEWTEKSLWLRRTFMVERGAGQSAFLRVHHDEDIEVYLNGERIITLPYYTLAYVDIALGDSVLELLQPGENVLAARCRKLALGQYCDLGLYDSVPAGNHP